MQRKRKIFGRCNVFSFTKYHVHYAKYLHVYNIIILNYVLFEKNNYFIYFRMQFWSMRVCPPLFSFNHRNKNLNILYKRDIRWRKEEKDIGNIKT